MKTVFLSGICENIFQSTGGKTIKIFRVLSVTVDIKLTVLNTIVMSLKQAGKPHRSTKKPSVMFSFQ